MWNGSGLYQRVHDWTTDAGNGVDIEASRMDAEDDSFAAGLNNCVTKDGQNNATADLPMGGFKHTNVANASAANQYASLGQLQAGAALLLGSVSGTDTITGSLSPAITAYASGQNFTFIPAGDNTGATTININGLGAKNIFSQGAACAGGEIKANVPCQIIYDGTQFNILSPYNFITSSGPANFTNTVKGPFITKNVLAAHNNLVITRTSATVIRVQADELLLEDSSGNIYKASSVDENITITTSGISGLDATDTEGSDTWYYLFILYDGTNVNGFMSDSLTPTFPSGYTYSAYVGAAYNDSSSDLLNFRQANSRVVLDVPITDINASSVPSTHTTASVTVPPNAIALLSVYHTNTVASYVLITETAQTETTPTALINNLAANTGFSTWVSMERRADASSEIRYSFSTLAGSEGLVINTIGWVFND